ncbi:MAG TPA: bile acid:sodium symporter, partial [Xanthomonadales bacterium]|nr:bile acid:sodium symporter [Xanthomonadales bacterium]
MIETIYKVFVPAGLILLMFGMGLQLTRRDWLRLVRLPRAVLAGLLGQFILLPAVAFLMVYFLSLPLAVAAGIVILAACPGGVVSNSISFLARADIALSVTLTAVSSVLALLTVPLIVSFGLEIV